MLNSYLRTSFAAVILTVALGGCTQAGFTSKASDASSADSALTQAPAPAVEAKEGRNLPSLIVTNEPPPGVIYRRGSRDTVLANNDSSGSISIPFFTTENMETAVTRKAIELGRELGQLQDLTDVSSSQLRQLQAKNESRAAEYYALVASINAELQSGTTLGNPILVDRWNIAQDKLNGLSQDTGSLSSLASDLSNQASRANYLLEATQNAFTLSGAVKEDHKKLSVVEDGVNQSVASINRLLIKTNDEISRRISYLRAERANLQSLFLGVTNGELYGQSLSNSLFKRAAGGGGALFKPTTASDDMSAAPVEPVAADASSRRPLVIIRFDRPNVNYDQPLYAALSQALEKYPSAQFDLVAVSSNAGNPAQTALSSAEARKNGEAVLRSLSQMGLPIERVNLNAATAKDVVNSEVHLYLR